MFKKKFGGRGGKRSTWSLEGLPGIVPGEEKDMTKPWDFSMNEKVPEGLAQEALRKNNASWINANTTLIP